MACERQSKYSHFTFMSWRVTDVWSSDNTEGVKSFLEKRPVRFVGSMAKGTVVAYPWFALLDTSNRAKAVAATTPSKL